MTVLYPVLRQPGVLLVSTPLANQVMFQLEHHDAPIGFVQYPPPLIFLRHHLLSHTFPNLRSNSSIVRESECPIVIPNRTPLFHRDPE